MGRDVEAGEQARAAVHAPDVVGTVAADVGELEGEEAEDGLQGGEGAGAGIAGALDGLVDAVAAEQRQEAEEAGSASGLEQFGLVGVEGHGLGRAEGGGANGGPFGLGAAREAGEALAVEDRADGAFAGRLAGGGVETGLDVGDGEIELAEADDFVMGGGRKRGAGDGLAAPGERKKKLAGSARERKSRTME